MRRIGIIKRFLFSLGDWIYVTAVIIYTGLGTILSIDHTNNNFADKPVAALILKFAHSNALTLMGFISVVVFVAWCVRKGTNPWVLDKIQFILDQYQEKCFQDQTNDPKDHHRVTLFRRKRCLWGNKGHRLFSLYLVPYLRSNHLAQRSGTKFLISDNSDQTEGVAGQAWSRHGSMVLNNLPDIHEAGLEEEDRRARIEDYAATTYCPEQMVDKYAQSGTPMPRSIAAIPVDVKGTLWGVIVLDSRSPYGVNDNSVLNYSLTVAVIGQLLEKV